jgi:hypothetical protein
MNGEFVASYRAKLLGALVGLNEFIDAKKPESGLLGFAALDNGNGGQSPPDSALPKVLKKLGVGSDFYDRSFIVAHENFPMVSGSKEGIALGSGCYYDGGARSRYAVDTLALAKFLQKEERAGVKIQRFGIEASLPNPSGSRGAVLGTRLSISGVDVGIPVAGLNSSREVIAVRDVEALSKLVRVHFSQDRPLVEDVIVAAGD